MFLIDWVSFDLKLLENLWQDLKIVVYDQQPIWQGLNHLENDNREMSHSPGVQGSESNPERLTAVIAAKGDSTIIDCVNTYVN
jgi:hypothetical protein